MLPIIGMISFFAFLLGFFVFLIVLIVQLIRGKSVNLPAIGMLVFAVLLLGSAVVNTATGEAGAKQDAGSLENQVKDINEGDLSAENGDSIKSGTYTLPSGFNIDFSSSVANDVTGNWRISTTSDNFVPADYAVEYYEMMFSSDREIHAIWNAALGTTTRIMVMSGFIFADTLEYVDGEELDAKLLFSGQLLNSKVFDAKTGEEVLE